MKKGGAHDLLEDEMLSKEKAYEDKVHLFFGLVRVGFRVKVRV